MNKIKESFYDNFSHLLLNDLDNWMLKSDNREIYDCQLSIVNELLEIFGARILRLRLLVVSL